MPSEIYIGRDLHDQLPRLLSRLKERLRICAYELNPTLSPTQPAHQPLVPQLRAISKSGIDCRIILATSSRTANVRINNTHAAHVLAACGWQVKLAKPQPLHHCKIWLLDDYLAIVGSHNLTIGGLTKNREVSLGCQDAAIIAKLHQFFADTWNESTTAQY